jgi:hypothetical protein
LLLRHNTGIIGRRDFSIKSARDDVLWLRSRRFPLLLWWLWLWLCRLLSLSLSRSRRRGSRSRPRSKNGRIEDVQIHERHIARKL